MKMTDAELNALGIVRTPVRARGSDYSDAYIYRCATCGRETTKKMLILSRPIYCGLCRTDAKAKIKAAKRAVQQEAKALEGMLGIDHKQEDRFYNGSQIVRKLGEFEEAVTAAFVYAHLYGSVPEVVVAILLISCGVSIVPQAKIFESRRSAVDFLLPEHKIAIEVDGKIYHTDKNESFFRDEQIKRSLGDDWAVLHLPADDVVKRPKVFKDLLYKRFK